MKRKKIPFVPFKVDRAKVIARHFLGWGEAISTLFPSLTFELEQCRFDLDPREWVAIAFYSAILYSVIVFSSVFVVAFAARVEFLRAFGISIFVGFIIGFFVLLYLVMYPKLFVNRRVKELERNLPYALHHLLIQIRSGVPLFNSIVSISRGEYGLLSKEFRRAVTEISTGESEVNALEDLAKDNPSLYFRRIMWQVVNALKTGADIGLTLKEIVDNLVVEQKVAIKKYGSELNPLALFYMVLVVIFPTLGIVFLLILFSFVGSANINIQFILLGIIGFLFIVQFMFIGMIKSRRPVGI